MVLCTHSIGGQALLVMAIFIVCLCFFLILSFLSSPAQRWLSEQTEIALTGSKGEIKRKKGFFKRLFSSIFGTIHAIFDMVVLLLIALCMNFIPVVGIIISGLISSYLMASTYFEFPLDRRDLTYSERKKLLKKNIGYVFGFGLLCMAFTALPSFMDMIFTSKYNIILSVFIVPCHVVGATLLCVEKIAPSN